MPRLSSWIRRLVVSRGTYAVLFRVLCHACGARGAVSDYATQVSASVQKEPPQITLQWPSLGGVSGYTVYRRLPDQTSWTNVVLSLPGTATNGVDTNVAVGVVYEYRVIKTGSITSCGYVCAGIEAPLVEHRGKVILVVDQTFSNSLARELEALQLDLVGDGWTVLRRDVSRGAAVADVKAVISSEYHAAPSYVKAVLLFGHVPVPYSGAIAPDGHDDHIGAWPADVYYGDMDGSWTDTSVCWTNTSWGGANNNVPGDGKFDTSTLSSEVELQVGRVDLWNMGGNETVLLRQYLKKDYRFRHGLMSPQRRGLVTDGFGEFYGEAFAANGFRNFAALLGASQISSLPWVGTLSYEDYLWAYGCGGGTFTSASGVGGASDIINNNAAGVFNMLFGSYFGDWNVANNFLRAPLATATRGLACAWAGRPNWYFHPMGMGETIGYSTRCTQNNTSYSPSGYTVRDVHVALMGDPTLRMHPVLPASYLTAVVVAQDVQLRWIPSADGAVVGYHVYRSDNVAGPYARLTTELLMAPAYADTSTRTADVFYMVRAIKLETSGSGTYFNPSQGTVISVTQAGAAKHPPIPWEPEVSCSILAPTNGAFLYDGNPVTITAAAMTGGTNWSCVTNVAFYADGLLIGSDGTAPYTCAWSVNGLGNHTLTAKAMNEQGICTNASVTITAVSRVTCAITTPANWAIVKAGTNVEITAGASSLDTAIAKVEFLANGLSIGEDTTAPYSCVWSNVAVGDHTLVARATDGYAGTGASAAVILKVTAGGVCSGVSATGGTVTNYTDAGGTNWTAHIFTNSSTFAVTVAGAGDWVEYLILGGGGGGGSSGSSSAGGGGAGGYRCSVQGELSGGGSNAEARLSVVVSNYSIVVGGGGSAGSVGNPSSFAGMVALGGGVGRAYAKGGTGGSGGGGSANINNGGDGTSGQGYKGGGDASGDYAAGGGGGAGGVGADTGPGHKGGNGGTGVVSWITGVAVSRAGGGGGTSWDATGGTGQSGGGNGGSSHESGTAAMPYTGGGGGGGATGGAGGSGIVIVRYVTGGGGVSAPVAPTGVVARAAGTNRITLTWVDISTHETGYVVNRSLDSTNWAWDAFGGVNATNISDTGLATNTLYYYRVAASNAAGLSSYAYASARTWTVAEAWRHAYFSAEQSTNAAVSADEADPDQDGLPNWMERIAGTDPTNSASSLTVSASTNSPAAAGQFVVCWPSVSGRSYAVIMATNLLTAFAPRATGILATPPMNVHTDNVGSAGGRFYRVQVE